MFIKCKGGIMAAFADPFSGNVDRKLNNDELIQALRIDLSSELEAIYLYDAHIQATDDEIAKKVLADIREEEKIHVGELIELLKHLDPSFTTQLISGEDEVKNIAGL
jgi:rubrerythrin